MQDRLVGGEVVRKAILQVCILFSQIVLYVLFVGSELCVLPLDQRNDLSHLLNGDGIVLQVDLKIGVLASLLVELRFELLNPPLLVVDHHLVILPRCVLIVIN